MQWALSAKLELIIRNEHPLTYDFELVICRTLLPVVINGPFITNSKHPNKNILSNKYKLSNKNNLNCCNN